MPTITWAFGAMALCLASQSNAVDWSSCASDLDSLRRRAADASSAAQEADSKKRAFDDAVREFNTCRSSPAVFDLLRDGCRSKRSDAEYAQSSYRSALSSLQSALSDVDSKVRSVSGSCEVDVGRPSAATNYLNTLPADLRAKCSVFVEYTGRLPKEQLLQACRKTYSASECAKCLP